jgi:general secretion pathway protein E
MPDTDRISPELTVSQILIDRGRLDASGLERAQRLAEESGERLEPILTKLGLVSERDLAEAYCLCLDTSRLEARSLPQAPLPNVLLSRKFLRRARILPLEEGPDHLTVAMADPLDETVVAALEFAVEKRVRRRVALPSDIDAAIERLYGEGKSSLKRILEEAGERSDDAASEDIDRLKDLASDAPVIRLVNLIITKAVEARASDIHLESAENRLRVRYRIDGVLHEMESPPARLRAAVISRIKIMAKLNIAERRLAQDGRIRMAVRGKEIDFRVSTTPAIHGESVVLRILDRGSLALDFAALGFDGTPLEKYLQILRQPHGIVLVTGPTGSGKTTTLYTSLLTLNTADRKILTVEDPVEYLLEGINQVQVKPAIGLTFASALRSFLRQDPDIMMVGEIRDLETAQIAVQAALTGHLVLSTLHTNDAASAVTRLLDMGLEDYLLTSTINGLVAQRLVRRLCPRCRDSYVPVPDFATRLEFHRLRPEEPIVLYRAKGCEFCGQTGYFGRTMIVEVLAMTDAIRQLVLKHAEAREIQIAAREDGMQTMYEHGLCKALDGITTVEEVLRVVHNG